MSNETKKTIGEINHTDSLRAVKVSYDLAADQQKQVETLAKLIKGNHENLVLLTTKVMKLEKKIEDLEAHVEAYANREL
jgi:cell division protein FtsB